MTATANAKRSGSRALPWLLGIGALVLVAIIAGAPRSDDGIPFDPESSKPAGGRALVLLLESFGADVTVTSELPDDNTAVAFMFYDVIPEDRQDAVEQWVLDGGTLVVSDPYSAFTPEVTSTSDGFGMGSLSIDRGDCDVEGLETLENVEPGPGAVGFETPEGSQRCFTAFALGDDDVGSFVVSTQLGEGRVVAIGAMSTFTNELLGEADNAALATALLLPAGGELQEGDTVAFLEYGDEAAAADDRSLTDALSTGARLAMAQLAVAFLVYAWFRARRVGKPVLEPQPVAIAGSELVSAVGQLLQQSHDPNRAARALRADLRRRLGERFGLGPNAEPDVLAGVVAERSGIDPARLFAIVSDHPVNTDRELVELAATIDDVRKEILHGP